MTLIGPVASLSLQHTILIPSILISVRTDCSGPKRVEVQAQSTVMLSFWPLSFELLQAVVIVARIIMIKKLLLSGTDYYHF